MHGDPGGEVVLVDARDVPVGTAGKLRAHEEGLLHRAFSVFVFDREGSLLLQRRADGKYHSGGLWSNTCCSHPRPGEPVEEAAHRRLREEMGFDCALAGAGHFTYRAGLGNGLIEHELDHVFSGVWSGVPHPDPAEVGAWKWCPVGVLEAALRDHPETFTAWLPLAWHQLAPRVRPVLPAVASPA